VEDGSSRRALQRPGATRVEGACALVIARPQLGRVQILSDGKGSPGVIFWLG